MLTKVKRIMKKAILIISMISAVFIASSCRKDTESERFKLLTGHIWQSDELLVNGVDASGPGQALELFVGDAEFKVDGTGYFGQYEGTWYFSNNENNITITSPELIVPLTTSIIELTSEDFRITTSFIIPGGDPTTPSQINISFKAKP
jgi:hypothetical protein